MTALALIVTVLALLAGLGALFVLRRYQPRVPAAPVVELATVPRDRRWWVKQRLSERRRGSAPQPPSPTAPPVAPAPAPAPVPAPPPAPLAAAPHSPFARDAVRADGRIALPDDDQADPSITWHTDTADAVTDLPVAAVLPARAPDRIYLSGTGQDPGPDWVADGNT